MRKCDSLIQLFSLSTHIIIVCHYFYKIIKKQCHRYLSIYRVNQTVEGRSRKSSWNPKAKIRLVLRGKWLTFYLLREMLSANHDTYLMSFLSHNFVTLHFSIVSDFALATVCYVVYILTKNMDRRWNESLETGVKRKCLLCDCPLFLGIRFCTCYCMLCGIHTDKELSGQKVKNWTIGNRCQKKVCGKCQQGCLILEIMFVGDRITYTKFCQLLRNLFVFHILCRNYPTNKNKNIYQFISSKHERNVYRWWWVIISTDWLQEQC